MAKQSKSPAPKTSEQDFLIVSVQAAVPNLQEVQAEIERLLARFRLKGLATATAIQRKPTMWGPRPAQVSQETDEAGPLAGVKDVFFDEGPPARF